MYVNTSTFIIFMGIVQGYFLTFILLSNRKGNLQANRFLGLLICAFSTSILNILLLKTHLYWIYLHTSKISASITLLFGPLFLFYVSSLMDPAFRLNRRNWFHFLPALVVFGYYVPYYMGKTQAKYTFIFSPTDLKSFRFEHYEYLAMVIGAQIHLWVYLAVVYRLIKEHQRKVKDNYSNIEQHNLSWIQFFISLFALVYIIIFLLCIILLKFNYMISYSMLGVTVSVAIFILGYRGLKQTEIFTLEPPLKKVKSESVGLTGELVQSLTNQLNIFMEKEKLFTCTELNLDDLAKKLSVSKNILSQYINDYLKTNFYDYINRMRIEEMKRLLLDPEKEYMTIVALANEAGFNAKTTYNRIFKQYTGMTPSEFRQMHDSREKLTERAP